MRVCQRSIASRRIGSNRIARSALLTLSRHEVDRRVFASSVDFEVEFVAFALVDAGDRPERSTALMCTKASGWPSSRTRKPKPFIELKNFTVPVAFSPVSRGAAHRPLRRGHHHATDRNDVADNLQILRGNLAAAIHEVEFQLLPGEAFKAGTLDCADVNEDVFTAAFLLDEAEALLAVEELDRTLARANDLGGHAVETAAAAAVTAAETATAITAATETATVVAAAEPIVLECLRGSQSRTGPKSPPKLSMPSSPKPSRLSRPRRRPLS